MEIGQLMTNMVTFIGGAVGIMILGIVGYIIWINKNQMQGS